MMLRTVARRALLALAVAGVGVAGGVALAREHGLHHPGMWKAKVGEHVDEALGAAKATPPQRAAIHAALDHVFATAEENHKDRGPEMERALAMFESDTLDTRQIEAMRAEREGDMQKTGDAIVQAVSDAHDALTAPQRRLIADWVRSHKPAHMGEGPKHGAMFIKSMVSSRIDQALDAARVTVEQRTAIHAARDHVFAAFEQAHSQDPSGRIGKALELFEADKLDQTKVAELRAEHVAQARIIGDALELAIRDAHDALTPVQRKAVADFVRANHPHGEHGGPGGPG